MKKFECVKPICSFEILELLSSIQSDKIRNEWLVESKKIACNIRTELLSFGLLISTLE